MEGTIQPKLMLLLLIHSVPKSENYIEKFQEVKDPCDNYFIIETESLKRDLRDWSLYYKDVRSTKKNQP